MSPSVGWRAMAIALTLCLASCAHDLTASVRPHPSNEGYLLYYHPDLKMLDEYGRGKENVRRDARLASSPSKIDAIWRKAFADASLHYIEANSLIPSECHNGVVIQSTGQAQDGNGWAWFKCK